MDVDLVDHDHRPDPDPEDTQHGEGVSDVTVILESAGI